MTRTWNLAKVVDVADPDKRRRLKLRFPMQSVSDIPDDKLLWVLPAQTGQSANFDLPSVGDTVLVLITGDLQRWLYLSDASEWQSIADDDYATALIRKHADVLSLQFIQSVGWTIDIAGKAIHITYDNVDITSDGKECTMQVGDIKVSTDGKALSVSNNSVDLKQLIDDLHTAIQQHTHTTPTGASGVPINLSKFISNKQDFDNLFKLDI